MKTRDHKLANCALLKVSNVCYWYDYFVNILPTLFGSDRFSLVPEMREKVTITYEIKGVY